MPDAADEDPPPTADQIEVLVDSHAAFLGFLAKRVGRDVAQDLLQDAFARGLDKLPGLELESVTAWFYRVLRNAVVDHHRRGGASERALARLASELEADTGPDPDTHATVCRCVARLAGTLKPEYADALRRVEVDGASVQQFAADAGITPNNAAVRVFRAREALRKRVARTCGVCATHGCLDCTCRGAGEH